MKILPGNAINRQYRNFRKIRNNTFNMFTANLTPAGLSAHRRDLPFTIALGALSLIWVKHLENSVNAMLPLRKPYKEILKRTVDIKMSSVFKKKP